MSMSIAGPGCSEVIIKKSRFLGFVRSVESRAQATQIVMTLRAEHPQAAHICWALIAGGESAVVDDGEPSGTAGRPIFDILRHQDLEGVLAVVVRYYGGIKLGAGGLVRAYSEATSQALLNTTKIARIEWLTIYCSIDYAIEGAIRRVLEAHDAQLVAINHNIDVTLEIRVPQDHKQRLMDDIIEISQGRAVWR